MSVTEAAGQANPSWWSQCNPGGEADPCDPNTGGKNDSFGFADLLDVINPLQHIPVVSTLYRELTGDTMSEAARMAGGAVWGGPAGVIGALANSITEAETGGDIGATTMAYLRGEELAPGSPASSALVAEAPQAGAGDLTDPLVGALPAGMAQFAAAGQAAEPGAVRAAGSAATLAASRPGAAQVASAQEFSGNAASRLDAFIQRANAVRAPSQAPVKGRDDNGLNVRVTPSATQKTAATGGTEAPQSISRAAPSQPATPLKLASDGNTDVANWMMRALDRYESMKTHEQS